MSRIKGVRKKLSEDLGFLVQPVHIRDNLEIGPNSYRITILGAPVGEADVQVAEHEVEISAEASPKKSIGCSPEFPLP